MAARPVEKKSRLHHILVVEAGVAENIAKWITDDEEGPQCESPADFAKLWSTATMATGPKVDVLDRMDPVISTDTFKGRKIAGRLQAAWDFCSQDLAGEARQLAAPPKPEEESDTQLWPDPRREACEQATRRLYKLSLAPDQIPASPLMQRLDRNWKDKKAEIVQLSRMRTQADFDFIMQQPARERSLGIECGEAALFLRQGTADLPPVDLDSVDQVLQAIEVMSNGWLLLGTKEMPSKLKEAAKGTPTTVYDFDINDSIAWPKFTRKMARSARSLGDSESSVVRYLRIREHQTRKAALRYWREEDYPWGEALQKAQSFEMAVLWTVTAQTNTYGIQVNIPGITDVPDPALVASDRRRPRSPPRSPSPLRKPQRTREPRSEAPARQRGPQQKSTIPKEYLGIRSADLRSHMLCIAFNDRGCSAETPSLCPQGRLHRCSFVLTDGTFCGASGHGKQQCPYSPANGGHGVKDKGKGKGSTGNKGGGKGTGKGLRR